jgi:hypothetical protein
MKNSNHYEKTRISLKLTNLRGKFKFQDKNAKSTEILLQAKQSLFPHENLHFSTLPFGSGSLKIHFAN